MKEEIGWSLYKLRNDKTACKPPEARREACTDLPPSPQKEPTLLGTLIREFWPPEPTMRQYIPIV